ncbi:MAG: HNH endonuclease signature motif containing protein [Actinomycetota bacterium]
MRGSHGAILDASLAKAAKKVSAETLASDGDYSPFERRQAAALTDIARNHIVGPSQKGTRFSPFTVLVHLNAEKRRAYYDTGGRVADDSLVGLLCDAALVKVVHGPGRKIELGRTQRLASKALRVALLQRDRTCQTPGCNNKVFLTAHHLAWWGRDGGRTDSENLEIHCSFHHRSTHNEADHGSAQIDEPNAPLGGGEMSA